MSIDSALRILGTDRRFRANIAAWEVLPAREPVYAPVPHEVDSEIVQLLHRRGIDQLYSHQSAAISAVLRGENVIVATATASGKTLCYNLVTLQRLRQEPRSRALYLFPTKALAQDQAAELELLMELFESGLPSDSGPQPRPSSRIRPSAALLTAAVYDGDTLSSHRPRIRDVSRVVLSNPDMLHMGILPQHTRWADFFSHLGIVVIDEVHTYRGVFGSHVANVIRRLKRICRFYGSSPQFILTSATISNPEELARKLIGEPATLVGAAQDGAPQGERHVIFYNPPLIDEELAIRRSASSEATALATQLVTQHLPTIIFAPSRLTTELMLTSLRDGVRRTGGSAASVQGYRSGYLSSERRAIEHGLRDGAVQAVVTTTALELGVDIGQLSAAILTGYPGTISSARQQMGRAGRRIGASVAVLVASAAPLDQYIVRHPEYLLHKNPEHALLNPDNDVILASHLLCAAAELPLENQENYLRDLDSSVAISELLEDLVTTGRLHEASDRYYWAGEGSPAASIGLRTGSPDRILIQARGPGSTVEIIGEVDRPSVSLLLYPGAIYLHGGSTYQVASLDLETGVASVQAMEADFYTLASTGSEIEVVEGRGVRVHPPVGQALPRYRTGWGDVRVLRKTTGYRMLQRGTNELLGFGTVELPSEVLETQGCWLSLEDSLIEKLREVGDWLSDPNDYGPEWETQRTLVRERDGHRCRACGAPELGREHHVHHRIPFRAFLADPVLREGLSQSQAWRIANRLQNLITLCPTCHRRAEANVRLQSGLGGLATLLAAVTPLYLMCDPRDLGIVAEMQSPGEQSSGAPTSQPMITLYENIPAGVGYAEQIFQLMPDLLRSAYDLVNECPCQNGCPACVGPVIEHAFSLDTKRLALAILREVCQD